MNQHQQAISSAKLFLRQRARRRWQKLAGFVLGCALLGVGLPAFAWAQTIKVPELYEQCSQPLAESAAQTEAVTKALTALKDPDAKKRLAATQQLAKSCDPRATEPLVNVIKKDADLSVQLAATEAIGKLGDRLAVDPLVEYFMNLDVKNDAQLRGALGLSLGSFPVHAARNSTLNVLVNPGGLRQFTEAEMYSRCLGVLVVNQMRDVRFSRKAIGFLFEFLENSDPKVKLIAEQTTAELKNTRNGIRELIGILQQHTYPPFRLKAAVWLGQWGAVEAREALAEASVSDRDASVKLAAKEALEKLK